MPYALRAATSQDYGGIIAVFQQALPEVPVSPETLAHEDQHRDPKCKHARWVAEAQGRIVGVAELRQNSSTYHPQKFWIEGCVLPQFQNRGIGSALLDQVFESLLPYNPLEALCATQEHYPHTIRFITQRGFVEHARAWESHLDLAAFDPQPYADLLPKLERQGIALKSYADLAYDPDRDRKLHDLYWATKQDEPTAGGDPTPVSFEQFQTTRLGGPNFKPDGYFVAVDPQGEYLAFSSLWTSKPGEYIWIGMTGTHADHRNRGLATALKLRGIEYAKRHGFKQLCTTNNSRNGPMLAINERMGFVRQPAIVVHKRLFTQPHS